MTTFKNREHAGELLYEKLRDDHARADLVVTLPRGGIPVGSIIANKMNIPLRLILIRKIGHPVNPEFAIGAISESDLILNDASHFGTEYLKKEIKNERLRITEMKKIFHSFYIPNEIKGKKVILVDDGIATGTCLQLALKELYENGAESIWIASPVCAYNTYHKLNKIADHTTCLLIAHNFLGIGAYYDDFRQLTDELAIDILNKKKLPNHLAVNY